MINFRTLASSSAGNCYVLDDGHTRLLLECGISMRDLRRGLGTPLSEITACLVTHEHGDHACSARALMDAGVALYTSAGTAAELGLSGHMLRIVEPCRFRYRIGSWSVLPFDVRHDAKDPLGFVLDSGGSRFLFLTDSSCCPYKFPDVTHVAVECNYALDILRHNSQRGELEPARKNRVMRWHMGLERVIELFRANDWPALQRIWLLHLSDASSDEDRFKQAVQAATGVPVEVAPRNAIHQARTEVAVG